MYRLDKQLHGQSLPSPKPLVVSKFYNLIFIYPVFKLYCLIIHVCAYFFQDKSLLKKYDIHDSNTFISASDPGLVVTTSTIGTASKQYLDVINKNKNLYTLLESEDTSCEMDVDVEEETTNVPASSGIIVTPDRSSIPPPASSSSSSSSIPSLLYHSTNNSPESMDSKTLSRKHRRKRERKKKKKEEMSRETLNRDQKTRRLLDTLAHRKLVAKIRRGMVDGNKNAKVIHSFGAWKLRYVFVFHTVL